MSIFNENVKTYLFYDLETSGLDKSFDQIMQFAAIRTDEHLKEIERFDFLVKLNADTIIDPYAITTHHISIEDVLNAKLSDYESLKKIHEIINKPNTVSLGYNTLGFDDEFLRFSFHKNLLEPYSHQYANNCYRMDLFPMVMSYYLFDNSIIKFPEENGKPSFKLENLNNENKFVTEGNAHNAIVDIEVTLELARKLIKNKKMWEYLENKFIKKNDESNLNKIKPTLKINNTLYQQCLIVNGVFGYDNLYQSVVICLGQHWHYKNQTIYLRIDTIDIQKSTLDEFKSTTWIVKKKNGDLPLVFPAVSKTIKHISEERTSQIISNKKWLVENPDIFEKIKTYYLDYKYPIIDNIDSDSNLYSLKFLTNLQKNKLIDFNNANIQDKIQLLDRLEPNLKKRATRMLGRNFFKDLPENLQQEYKNYLLKITAFEEADLPKNFYGESRRSISDVQINIINLIENGEMTEKQLKLLSDLAEYLSLEIDF